MKVKTTAYIHFHKWPWDIEGTYELLSFKADDNEIRTFVCEQEVEIDVPDNYDPRAQQIAALEAAKNKAREAFQATLADLNERISKLQAISYTEGV